VSTYKIQCKILRERCGIHVVTSVHHRTEKITPGILPSHSAEGLPERIYQP